MSATLQDAIAALRTGDVQRAQAAAVETLQAEPDNPHAWYLLSQLVDSDARRAAYLARTLALDPQHPRARDEFAALPPEVVAQLGLPGQAVEAVAEPELAVVADAVAEPAGELEGAPDWIRSLGAQPVAATPEPVSEPDTTAATVPPPVTKKATQPAKPAAKTVEQQRALRRKQENRWLTVLLILLALVTIAVLSFLGYLLFA